MHEKKIMIWLCHGAASCATLLCVRDVSGALKEFHIVTRRVLHLKWLSDFFCCSAVCCAVLSLEKKIENTGGRVRIRVRTCVCVCVGVCHRRRKVSGCVWRKPDASVMGTLGLLLLPLVLISQVDEQISSSPNPSPRIPAHMRRGGGGVTRSDR